MSTTALPLKVWVRPWLFSPSTRPPSTSLLPLPASLTVMVFELAKLTWPKVSVLLVPFSVIVRLPPMLAVPLAKLRLRVPPNARLPPITTLLAVATVMSAALVLSRVPAVSVSVPAPIALAWFTFSRPAVSVTALVVLEPRSVSVPAALFIVVAPV